eukprot:g2481.t1
MMMHTAARVTRKTIGSFGSRGAASKSIPLEMDLARFRFDLNGFVVLRNVLNKEEIDAMNRGIDSRIEDRVPRNHSELKNATKDSYFSARESRIDLGGMLTWPKEQGGEGFRSLLNHARIAPYLREFLGQEYRLDHQPMCIIHQQHSEGFKLHGGPLTGDGHLNPELQYRSHPSGSIWNSLLAMSVSLSEQDGPRDGGLCLLRGSHKGTTFPVPGGLLEGTDSREAGFLDEHLCLPSLNPGDVVLFSEATVHGARPWIASHERRLALYRFSPRNFAYGRSYVDAPDFGGALDLCTSEQSRVLRPPYSARLCEEKRSEAKMEHDKKTFGHAFF